MIKGIGARIQSRRKELKIGADELAQKIGKSKATLYRYENGDIENVPLDVLMPIAEALEITPDYLMGWEEGIKQQPEKMAERHVEIIMDEDFISMYDDFHLLDASKRKIVKDIVHNDEDFTDMFPEFHSLDATKRKIVKDLVHSLAEIKKAEV